MHESSTLYTGLSTSGSVDTMDVDAEDYPIATRVLRVNTYPNSPLDGKYATSPLCMHIIKDGITKRRRRYVCTLLRTVLRNAWLRCCCLNTILQSVIIYREQCIRATR